MDSNPVGITSDGRTGEALKAFAKSWAGLKSHICGESSRPIVCESVDPDWKPSLEVLMLRWFRSAEISYSPREAI
jgi:hypothetical protein